MSKAGSFALALFLLLAAMVAAAWGVTRLEPNRWGDGAELAFVQTADVCYWTPGRELDVPTAVELTEARDAALRARGDAANLCYVTTSPFGLPSAHDIDDARGPMTRAMRDLCPYDPQQGFGPHAGQALGPHAVRHGVAPAVSAIPSTIADAGAMIGGAAAALVAAALLALRSFRRRAGTAVAAVAATRAMPWLTPKRIGVVGAGWLMTVGVLAAAYPTLSQYLPHAPAITASDAAMPRTGRTAPGATTATAAAPSVDTPLPEQVAATSTAPNDFTVPAGASPDAGGAAGRTGSTASERSSSLPRIGNDFSGAPATGATVTPSAAATAQAAVAASNASAVPALPTTSFAAISQYLPPSAAIAPAVVSGSAPAAPADAPQPAATVTAPAALPSAAPPATPVLPAAAATVATPPVQTADAGSPAPAPVTQVAAAQDDDARAAIATTPIVSTANPLPSSPDAVLPVPLAPVQTAGNGGGNGQGAPTPIPPGGGTITRPVVALDGDDPAAAVPEPAMLGLFGMGVAALAARRRRGSSGTAI